MERELDRLFNRAVEGGGAVALTLQASAEECGTRHTFGLLGMISARDWDIGIYCVVTVWNQWGGILQFNLFGYLQLSDL